MSPLITTSSLCLAVLVCVQPCGASSDSPKDEEDAMIVTLEADGARRSVDAGGAVTLKLDCTPGTGYSWQLVTSDDRLLEAVGEPFFEPRERDGEEPAVGGSELQVFTFEARETGAVELELHYRRRWEEDAEPERVFRVTIEVREPEEGS